MKLTKDESNRLSKHISTSEKIAKAHTKWTEEDELKIVQQINDGKSTHDLIRELHISGRKVIDIKKKYKLYGA